MAEPCVKSAKRILYDNVAPNGSLNTNAAAGQIYNIVIPLCQ